MSATVLKIPGKAPTTGDGAPLGVDKVPPMPTSPLLEALRTVEKVFERRDASAWPAAHSGLHAAMQHLTPEDALVAAPRLAALAPRFGVGLGSMFAIYAGCCVELGAPKADCAPAILAGTRDAVEAAVDFRRRWVAAGLDPEDLPDPDGEPDYGLVERLADGDTDGGTGSSTGTVASTAADAKPAEGPDNPENLVRAIEGWWSLEQWATAALAVLADAGVRAGLGPRDGFVEAVRDLEDSRGDLRCLSSALLLLDDEPVVMLHRPSRTGYRVRISGLGDNFQLHTLLAHALIGGGHLPGEPPHPAWVAAATDAPLTAELAAEQVVGAFNMVAPDGAWIWNEGTPSDIPVVDGSRLLVLDPAPYERSWNNVRFFPMIAGELRLERVLDAAETERWFAFVTEPKDGTA